MTAASLFQNIPNELPAEWFTTLHQAKNLRIERIVSQGHRSPEGFWYDQDEHEWVLLLQGGAEIQFEGEAAPVRLGPGSYLNIPAHRRHRVASTTASETTIWLAIHYAE